MFKYGFTSCIEKEYQIYGSLVLFWVVMSQLNLMFLIGLSLNRLGGLLGEKLSFLYTNLSRM